MQTQQILAKVAQQAPMLEITSTYRGYLNRPVTNGFTSEITDKEIHIETAHIMLVLETALKKISLDDLNAKASKLRRLAKVNQTKLKGINKAMQAARENYFDYLVVYDDAQTTFDQLKAGWENYQLHEGWEDDSFYKEYLEPLRFKLADYKTCTSLTGRYRDFDRTLDSAIRLFDNSNYHVNSTEIGF